MHDCEAGARRPNETDGSAIEQVSAKASSSIMTSTIRITCMPLATRHLRRAFTLPELVIVVLIIAILSAAAVPNLMKSVELFHAEAAAKRIKVDLEMARGRARSTSASQLVDFDTTSHSYTIPNLPGLDHSSSDYTVDLTREPYGSLLTLVDFDGTEEVTFSGYGVPDNGGSIEVQAGTNVRTVLVESTTGKVTIQ